MKTYDKFLKYYDEIVRGINSPIDDEVDFLVEDVIKEYKPETKTILETACGTGVVAKELIQKGYKITGLDISKNMLEKAKHNIPEKNLILWDMTNFDLRKTFDTILCNYNSICHLLQWEQWQAFFKMAHKHLSTGGLFVFDINTVFEFENITRDFAQFYTFWDDNVCLEMFKKPWYFEWLVKIYQKASDGRFDLTCEVVPENSFPISQIKKELKDQGFQILEMVDYHYGEVTAQSERVYFICKKE